MKAKLNRAALALVLGLSASGLSAAAGLLWGFGTHGVALGLAGVACLIVVFVAANMEVDDFIDTALGDEG